MDTPADDRHHVHDDLQHHFSLAQGGSQEAANEVFRQCEAYVLRVIDKTLQGCLPEGLRPEDFVGMTFTHAFQADLRSDPPKSPEAVLRYLKAIAENEVRMVLRKTKDGKHIPLDHQVSLDGLPDAGDFCASGRDPLEELEFKELLEFNLPALARSLSPKGPRMLELRLQGCDNAQIAQELGIHVRTVELFWSRLRYHLEKMGRGGVNG